MNSVDFLLTNKDITYEIRTEIKRLGRPIPDLIISKTDVRKSRNYSRNFNSSVYERFKWLRGCPKRNKLFCFICLVMSGNQSAWAQEGYIDTRVSKNLKYLQYRVSIFLLSIPITSIPYSRWPRPGQRGGGRGDCDAKQKKHVKSLKHRENKRNGIPRSEFLYEDDEVLECDNRCGKTYRVGFKAQKSLPCDLNGSPSTHIKPTPCRNLNKQDFGGNFRDLQDGLRRTLSGLCTLNRYIGEYEPVHISDFRFFMIVI
ncbi:hypothetical protein NQ318_008177 [Aromia moschata]|uniref:Uncharacterized protein n=1 Tax=Aromia moschata TaxID=1265417 RepID=A0AAV8YK39_9CUCU|nr:hypothetical protein NQ318_008177 [Aromia moschata]